MSPILIAGAGIGGLSAAIALQRRGFEAHILEAAPELRTVGAGIWMPTNAMLVLARLGLAEQVAAAGAPIDSIELGDGAAVLKAIDLRPLAARLGYGNIAIHRAELHRILVDALRPGTLHLGRRVVRIEEESAGVRVHTDTGPPFSGSLLVGADGVRSTVRRMLVPEIRLHYSGQSAYRAAIRVALPEALRGRSREVWGPGRRFGFSLVSPKLVYWYATWDAPAGGIDRGSELRRRLQRFAELFPDPVPDLLAATPDEAVLRTDLFEVPRLPRWHRGRIVLLGDAAHACTPNLGQGGAQAIEDGFILARSLSRERSLAAALRAYEGARQARCTWIGARSREAGQAAHWRDPLRRAVRNQLLRHLPEALIRRQLERMYRADVTE